ncbi:hypothetical protein L249_2247, partial [Ophiocordyceps polyrhachis-furcata BCC 54312]
IPVHHDTPSLNRSESVVNDAQSQIENAAEDLPNMSATATITGHDTQPATTTLVAAVPPTKRTSSVANFGDGSSPKRSNPQTPDENTSSDDSASARFKQRIAELERNAAEKDEQLKQEREKNADLSLENYLTTAHDLIYKAFEASIVRRPPPIVSSSSKTKPKTGYTTGMTNVYGKFCPTDLRPWKEFPSIQMKTWQDLFPAWNGDGSNENKIFPSKNILEYFEDMVKRSRIRTEYDLSIFLGTNVESPVQYIIDKLLGNEDVTALFNISNGIFFQGDERDMRQKTNESMELQRRGRADRYCCEDTDRTDRSILHVSEFKRPQLLTEDVIKRGLHQMNVFEDVACRKPLDDQAGSETRKDYSAEKLIGAAITQTFHYIIENGVDYGLLTTGEAFIFLKVDRKEPAGRLYYHLARPDQDVKNAAEGTSHLFTALGQYLAFTLMAAGKPGAAQDDDDQDMKIAFAEQLVRWGDSPPTPPSSSFDPDADSARGTRSKTSAQGSGQQSQGGSSKNKTQQSQGGSSKNKTQQTQGGSSKNKTQKTQGGSSKNKAQQTADERSRINAMFESLGGPGSKFRGPHEGDMPYCTQKCLAGIASGAALDESCPNVALHRGNEKRTHHRFNQTQFLDHLSKQLKWSMDRGVTRLREDGACGFTFKVTLLLYGYTMISKGTFIDLTKYLAQEAAVYERLRPIQGKYVPVCLGTVDLRTIGKMYFMPFGYNITYMMFLAWGGTAANRMHLDDEGIKAIEEKAQESLAACQDLGVYHDDVRLANMVVSEDGNKVMMIDFEPIGTWAFVDITEEVSAGTEEEVSVGTEEEVSAGTEEEVSAGIKIKEEVSAGTEEKLSAGTEEEVSAGIKEELSSSPPASKKRADNAETEPRHEPGRKTLADKTNHQPRAQRLTIQPRMQASQSSGSGTSLTSKKRTRDTETEPNQAARAKKVHVREGTCWEEPRWELRGRTVLVKMDRSSGSGPSKKRTRNATETEPCQAVRAKKMHLRHGSWAFRHETGKLESNMKMASRVA